MREIFTSGTVGGALGNQCFYPDNRNFCFDRGEFTFLIRILIDGRNNLLPVPPQCQLKYPVGRLNHQLSESINGV